MHKRKKPILKRMFPHSPFLRILFAVCLVLVILVLCRSAYQFYQIKSKEAELIQEQEQLEKEKAELEERKNSLKDPATVEQRARDELGLVKQGEVPYVK